MPSPCRRVLWTLPFALPLRDAALALALCGATPALAALPPLPPVAPAAAPVLAPLARPDMPPPPELASQAAYVLMDADTGAILAEKAPTLRWPPASLAKLMAAYLTYQSIAHGTLKLDQSITVSTTAWRTGGSRMFISPSQPVTVNQLLHGMLIDSGNDATVALAQAVAGTQGSFVRMMNTAAGKLGLSGTEYTNPTGLPDPGMFTTAADVATLSRALLTADPQILHITAHKHYLFDKIRQRSWNPVLFHDPTVDGLKTGRTNAAGHCIDATALRGGRRLIAVVLGGPSWTVSTKAIEALLDYGYQFYTNRQVIAAGHKLGTLTDPRTQPTVIPVAAARDVTVTLAATAAQHLTTVLAVAPPATGGIARGAVVGQVTINAGGTPVAHSPVVALEAAPPAGFLTLLLRRVRAML